MPRGGGGAVHLVLRVQREHDVQRARQARVRPVAAPARPGCVSWPRRQRRARCGPHTRNDSGMKPSAELVRGRRTHAPARRHHQTPCTPRHAMRWRCALLRAGASQARRTWALRPRPACTGSSPRTTAAGWAARPRGRWRGGTRAPRSRASCLRARAPARVRRPAAAAPHGPVPMPQQLFFAGGNAARGALGDLRVLGWRAGQARWKRQPRTPVIATCADPARGARGRRVCTGGNSHAGRGARAQPAGPRGRPAPATCAPPRQARLRGAAGAHQ